MLTPEDYLILYNTVQSKEVAKYIVKNKEIKYAIRSMVEVYKPDPTLWVEEIAQVANYDDPAYRCAYLYKYAPLHTCLVQDMFTRALLESAAVINPNFWSNNNCLNICSLGGGPGIDTIGVLSALHRRYGLLHCSAQIIESMPGWKNTFDAVIEELQDKYYGLSKNLTQQYFEFSYIVADLLGKMDSVVNKAIGTANLITMIKFLSAATCRDTAQMIKKIFNSMRHGAVVFIIDNACGGYSELVSRVAQDCRMVPVFGPLQYVQYTNAKLKSIKYGSKSCISTQVTVHLLMKPYALPIAEFNYSLKPITMDYKMKTSYCSSSNIIDYKMKIDYRSSSNIMDYKMKVDYSLSEDERQNKSNVVDNVNSDSSNQQISMYSGNNFLLSNNLTVKRDIIDINSQYKQKRLDYFNLKAESVVQNVSLSEPSEKIASFVDKSLTFVSESKEFDSRFNYPLYELFPQNKISENEERGNDLKNLFPLFINESGVKMSPKHASSVLQIDSEKRQLFEILETRQNTECKDEVEMKDIPYSSRTFNEVVGIKKDCDYCSKIKRINWLQKLCKFCNT